MSDDAVLVERLIVVIHEALGGDGWAYSDYNGNELERCRSQLERAARAAIKEVKND
jgi:hypothetical protein